MGNTTKFRGKAGGNTGLATLVYGKSGGSTLPAKYIYAKTGGVVAGVYSVLSPSGTSPLSGAGSGASLSGTATTSTSANVLATGNIGTKTYLWGYFSGDGAISCSNSTSSNPTFSRAFSGVANGTTSSPVSGVWRCTITDGDTGATAIFDCTISSLTWQNTTPAYGPFTASATANSASGSTQIRDMTCTATVDVGTGPVSGSMSYAWTVTVWGPGIFNSSTSNMTSQTCNVHFDFGVTPPHGQMIVASLKCVVTDNVTGNQANAFGSCTYTYS